MYIEIKNITKAYINQSHTLKVLKNISFSINKNNITTIYGHSGVGKTTLLKIIGGILRPDNGNILINKINIKQLNPTEKFSFLFQKK